MYHIFLIKLHVCIFDIKSNPYVYYTYISEVYKDLTTLPNSGTKENSNENVHRIQGNFSYFADYLKLKIHPIKTDF